MRTAFYPHCSMLPKHNYCNSTILKRSDMYSVVQNRKLHIPDKYSKSVQEEQLIKFKDGNMHWFLVLYLHVQGTDVWASVPIQYFISGVEVTQNWHTISGNCWSLNKWRLWGEFHQRVCKQDLLIWQMWNFGENIWIMQFLPICRYAV